jgi:arylsulfatase A-like enzyme
LDYRDVEKKISSDYYGQYKGDLQPFVDAHRDHYDEAIEYLDSTLAKFVQSVNQSSKPSNMMLVLTGDHGESFERGFLNHGEDLYESSIHVPLIIKSPNQRGGERSSMPVQSIDLAPTIVHALGLTVPQWMDGAPLYLGQRAESREIVTVNYKDPTEQKIHDRPTKLAIRWRHYKLIVSCDVRRAELYDLDLDPGEQLDLSTRESALANQLWKKLEERLAKQTHAVKMACVLNTQT